MKKDQRKNIKVPVKLWKKIKETAKKSGRKTLVAELEFMFRS